MNHNSRSWTLKRVEDRLQKYGNGYPPGTCEKCGKRGLRFVHIIERGNPNERKRLGACCAEKAISDYDAVSKQRSVRNQYIRVCRIPKRKWDESDNGNPTVIIDGWRLTVFPDKYRLGHFKFSIFRPNDTHYSAESYESVFEAKSAAGRKLSELAGWFEDHNLLDEENDVSEDDYDDD